MQKFIPCLLLICFFSIVSNVQAQTVSPFPKTINVNGSAEMEIIPDEIYVLVTLKEYEKKSSGKISLDKIKTDFLTNYRAVGLPDSLISIASYEGYNVDLIWRRKKKKEELYASISYQIKFKDSKKIDALVDRMDDDATQAFRVVKTSHSKIEELRRQLKIEAVKAAKEKADYIASAINEQVGAAVTIQEHGEYPIAYNMQYSNKAEAMMSRTGAGNEALPEVDFTKLKLRYEISAVFALK